MVNLREAFSHCSAGRHVVAYNTAKVGELWWLAVGDGGL